MKSHKFKSARLTHLTYLISVPACWSHCRHDEKMSQHKTCGPKSDAPSYSRNSQAKQYPTSEARDMKVLSRILPCFLKVRKKIAITPASPCHSLFFQGLWAVQAGGSDQQEETQCPPSRRQSNLEGAYWIEIHEHKTETKGEGLCGLEPRSWNTTAKVQSCSFTY